MRRLPGTGYRATMFQEAAASLTVKVTLDHSPLDVTS